MYIFFFFTEKSYLNTNSENNYNLLPLKCGETVLRRLLRRRGCYTEMCMDIRLYVLTKNLKKN